MYARSARYYDLIYRFKDYAREAREIEALIRKEHPAARSILDAACGTGEHAKHLCRVFQIDGIDLEPQFVEIAGKKVPSGRFWVADMSDFDLRLRYDVVQCLFGAIGYLQQPRQVAAALRCFTRHLNPGGIVIVEPWFSPEQWIVGMPSMATVDDPELKICRMGATGREGRLSTVHFDYLVGGPEGIEHFTEEHTLALYTPEEMVSFFEEADLAVRHDTEGSFGRGLYVAKRKPSAGQMGVAGMDRTAERTGDWSVLAEFTNHPEADLAKNLLERHGIPATVWSDDCGGVAPGQTFVQGVKLFVADSDREAALDILGKGATDA